MDKTDERPIFVVGAPRSGTTLLRYILCSHPRIYLPPESNFIPRFFSKNPGDPLQPQEAFRVLESILSYRVFFKDWQGERPDPPLFISALPDLLPRTILSALYKEYSRQFEAERWGDKSPIYTIHLDLLSRIFPQAHFIHIIRDGRDVALSMLKSYQGPRFFYMDLYFAVSSWQRRVRQAKTSAQRLGSEHYHEIRYEDLVTDPPKVISALCDFLGEVYEPAMAEPHNEARGHFHSKGIHAATRRPLTPNSAGRWRKEMSEADQRLIQVVAGDLLNELGYEIAGLGRMGLAEKARLARLQAKYSAIETGRRVLQAAGIFHPTALIAKKLKHHK